MFEIIGYTLSNNINNNYNEIMPLEVLNQLKFSKF